MPARVIQNVEPYLPPGYRFHPTDEELVIFYLGNKISDFRFTVAAIAEVDLNKCEPWDLPEKAKMGEKEWYFFSLKDRKYPTGLRTNRATEAGYWKATGKDREVMSSRYDCLVGMKKTLVFYKGRAPKGEKTSWIMHEYRLEGESSLVHFSKATKDEWVVCRVFRKNSCGKKTTASDIVPQCSLPALLESPRTVAAAEDSGVTESEPCTGLKQDPFSYVQNQFLSVKQSSEIDNMWLPRVKESSCATARYPEVSFEKGNAYITSTLRDDHLAQELRVQPPAAGSSASLNSLPPSSAFAVTRPALATAFPASGFVLKALLEQYSSSGPPCKTEPHFADASTKLNFRDINNSDWFGSAHLQHEAASVFTTQTQTLVSPAVNQISVLPCLPDVNTVATHSSDYHRIGRSISDQVLQNNMENVWTY